jgi:hypothetical protein
MDPIDDSAKSISVQQPGEIEGEVIRVGGKADVVPIQVRVEETIRSNCFAQKSLAKNLAKFLFEPVRLLGEGRWERDQNGKWNLEKFIVKDFKILDPISL